VNQKNVDVSAHTSLNRQTENADIYEDAISKIDERPRFGIAILGGPTKPFLGAAPDDHD
jgi:hypothetical protein